MTDPLTIEPMRGRHLVAVEAIDALAYSRAWSTATWRRELSSDDRRHLVARVGDSVVGHAGTLQVLDEVHVTTVAVHPDHEGRGVASMLVGRLLGVAARSGVTAATLEVRASHRRTQRLYARFGFVPAGVRRGYYREPADDAIVMWLADLTSDAVVDRIDGICRDLGGDLGAREESTS
jgi:ribosomal-protein-alanine N-acetyltransferase